MTSSAQAGGADVETETAQPQRFNSLTGLRIVVALAVYASHLPPLPQTPPWLVTTMASGYAGVTFFFVLSGFVLVINYWDRLSSPLEIWNYAAARVARIYPVYISVMIWPLVQIVVVHELQVTWLIQYVFAVQTWNPNLDVAYSFVHPAWSISVEFFLYATLPVIVMAVKRLDRSTRGLLALTLGIIAALFIAAFAFKVAGLGKLPDTNPASAHRWLYRTPLTRIGDFTVGALMARFAMRSSSYRWQHRLGTCLTFGALAACVGLAIQKDLLSSPWSWDAIWLVPAAALIFGLAISPRGIMSRILSTRVMIFLGEVSFCFYLVHTIAIDVLFSASWASLPATSMLFVQLRMLAAAVLLAIGLHISVERPSRTVLRRCLSVSGRSGARPARHRGPLVDPSM